jgi:2-oxoglutarate ferredoxin oxidoreductase subunit alpha
MHSKMNEKRIRKLAPQKRRRDLFIVQGDPDAPVGLIAWGSVAGVAMEALQLAHEQGLKVKLLIPKLLYPVAEAVYQEFFASVKRGLVVEQSHQGQLHRTLRMFLDVPGGMESFAKSGSNPILANEIVDRLRVMALGMQRKREFEPEPELG